MFIPSLLSRSVRLTYEVLCLRSQPLMAELELEVRSVSFRTQRGPCSATPGPRERQIGNIGVPPNCSRFMAVQVTEL